MLSESVANAFKYYAQPDTKETERFVRLFDKLFDCLNVRSVNEAITKKKPNLKPYKSATDERLKVSHTWDMCCSKWFLYGLLATSSYNNNYIGHAGFIIIVARG